MLKLLKDAEDRGLGSPTQDHKSSDGSMTPVNPVAVYQLPDNGRG